jgi:L-asparaginase
VKILGTGGTIANTAAGRIPIGQLLDDVPDVHKYAQLEAEDVSLVGSEGFTLSNWLQIGRAVWSSLEDPNVDGVVVTHGTFTAEETAFFLHLTMRTDKPVAIACSQRRHDAAGNDGDRNLIDAVRVVTSPQARGKGVLLVMAEEIHSARDVLKANQRPGGYLSAEGGPLGHVEVDQVTFYRSPIRRHTELSEFDIREIDSFPRVDIVSAYIGADDVQIRAVLEAGARGIVVNGFAFSGRPAPEQFDALYQARDSGVPVVLANRGGAGRIPHYSTGTEAPPFVKGDNLTAQKARILLMLALGKTTEEPELQRIYDQY